MGNKMCCGCGKGKMNIDKSEIQKFVVPHEYTMESVELFSDKGKFDEYYQVYKVISNSPFMESYICKSLENKKLRTVKVVRKNYFDSDAQR